MTVDALVTPKTTLVILLGASEWPHWPDLNSRAFTASAANSAREIVDYFLNQFDLPQENLRDLFNSEQSADDIDEAIHQFLSKRMAEMKTSNQAPRDVLVYFIGQAALVEATGDYYLAIRRTRERNPATSGLRIETLARTINEDAGEIRRIVVLDCHYAAAAFNAFQLQTKTTEAFKGIGPSARTQQTSWPKKGSAILCSSSLRGRSDSGEQYTKFSGALLHVLRTGVVGEWGSMSLDRVATLVKDFFDQTGSQAPRPEVHMPDQREGNVAKMPFFPNPWVEEAQRTQQVEENSVYDNDFVAFHNEGHRLALLGRYDESLVVIDQAIRLYPDYASTYMIKGFIFDGLKRYEEALIAYDQAVRLDPNLAAAYGGKGDMLNRLNRNEEALEVFEQVLRLDPNDAKAHYYKGKVLGDLKRHEEALAAYDQAIGLDPNNAAAYEGKGKVLGDLKWHEEALAAYDQAIDLAPDSVYIYRAKGVELLMLNRLDEALAAYDQFIRLAPKDTSVLFLKGYVLEKLNRLDEALAAFEQVIHLNPKDAFAYQRKGAMLDALGRHKEAETAYALAGALLDS